MQEEDDIQKNKEDAEPATHLTPAPSLNSYAKFQQLAIEYIKTAPSGCGFLTAYLDVKNFQSVNDLYGFSGGDRFLAELTHFLEREAKACLCRRIYADHFLILCMFPTTSETELYALARGCEGLLRSFIQRVKPQYPACVIEIYGGVCRVREGAAGVPDAIENANIARKEARKLPGTNCMWFGREMEERLRREKAHIVALQKALKEERFSVYLQPKVNLLTGKIVGAEALARWEREDGSVEYPRDFMPLLERNQDIVKLDFLVYRKTCAFIRSRMERDLPIVPISVNISRYHLKNKEFAKQMHQLISSYVIPPAYVEFELTENLFVDTFEEAEFLTGQLHEYGYKISIDDFGAGYSSFNLLQELPFDILKLDKKFVQATGRPGNRNAIIISSIIGMAEKLHASVVCEGVETLQQAKKMKRLGCKICQGFYFDQPVPMEHFEEILSRQNGYYRMLWLPLQKEHELDQSEVQLEAGKLSDSEAHAITHSLFHILPGGMAGIDMDTGQLLFLTEKGAQLIGYGRAELLDSDGTMLWYQKLMPAELYRYIEEEILRQLRKSDIFRIEHPITAKDGETHFIRLFGGYAHSPEWGRYLLCTFFDVTKDLEALASGEKLNRLFNCLQGGVAKLVLNEEFQIVEATDGFFARTGYTREECFAPPVEGCAIRLVVEEDRPLLRNKFIESAEKKRHVEYRILRKDGTVCHTAAYFLGLYEEGEKTLIEAFFIDAGEEAQ